MLETIQIKVKYFASLREAMAKSEEDISCASGETIGDLWQTLSSNKTIIGDVLMAKNQHYVDADSVLDDGDEIAFFPPVTGG